MRSFNQQDAFEIIETTGKISGTYNRDRLEKFRMWFKIAA